MLFSQSKNDFSLPYVYSVKVRKFSKGKEKKWSANTVNKIVLFFIQEKTGLITFVQKDAKNHGTIAFVEVVENMGD